MLLNGRRKALAIAAVLIVIAVATCLVTGYEKTVTPEMREIQRAAYRERDAELLRRGDPWKLWVTVADVSTSTVRIFLERTAADGNPVAEWQLGVWYQKNKGWHDASTRLFYRSAAKGNSDGQWRFGYAYASGRGVPQNYEEAFWWINQSAAQGNAWGQFLLADFYYHGYGVLQNYTEAARWFGLSADQGNSPAQCALGNMYRDGVGFHQDFAEALTWYRRAAALNDACGQQNLGKMYFLGNGVPQSDVVAYMWLNMADRNNVLDEEHSKLRERIFERIDYGQFAEALALEKKCVASQFKECE